jgi:cation transport regulator
LAYFLQIQNFLKSLKKEKEIMPYKKRTELPEGVKDHLPKHAQEIYQAAFNSAWDEYNHDEERAHRVAWAAVKHKYEKNESSGDWELKPGAKEND